VVETVLYDKRDRMAFVMSIRPAVKNAIDPRMHDELCRIWRDFRDDEEVDVAILSGAGGTFCAGADLRTYGTVC
jgi:enoyl-CoA hydratase/carnithine racemase